MKKLFVTAVLLCNFSMMFAEDYKYLESYLEQRIEISKMEIKTLKMKVKTLKESVYTLHLNDEKQHLKTLQNELDVVRQTMKEQKVNEDLKNDLEKSNNRLNNLLIQVKEIESYEHK